MPAKTRPKPLYQRGQFRLYRREDRVNLEIVWYDESRKRERSASAGSPDVGEGRLALDRLYLTESGHRLCPTCHRPWDHEGSPLLATAIADYLLLSEHKAGIKSARNRLGHVIEYIEAKCPAISCAEIDAAWVERFRKWLLARPVVSPKGNFTRARSLSHVEGCVMQLAAVITATPGERAQFRPAQAKEVARSPGYRADVPKLAAMFRFAMAHEYRVHLLRYLRMAVATWARPDAIFDVTAAQWNSAAKVLDLNPAGRRQTRKYRPKVPIANQFAPYLDELDGQWLPVTTIRQSWAAMREKVGLPLYGEAGEKLVRRTMATLARARIGEAQWRQGEMMLGHVKASVSDIYALPDPANLGLALAATEAIIDEIEALTPGAFYRNITADAENVIPLKVVKNGR